MRRKDRDAQRRPLEATASHAAAPDIEDLVVQARELGTKAFRSGCKAPAHDPAMMDLIAANAAGRESGWVLPLLDAWIGAWHAENARSRW